MTPLTSTSFAGGIDEKLSSIDIYAQTGEIFNGVDVLTISSAPAGSLLESLGAAGLKVPTSPMLMLNKMGEVAVNPAGVMASLTSASPALSAAIKGAPTSLQAALTSVNSVVSQAKAAVAGVQAQVQGAIAGVQSQVQSTLNGVTSQINTTIGGITSSISSVQAGAVTALTDVTAGLIPEAKGFSFSDISSKMVLATNTINQATKMGMGGVFSVVAQSSQFAGAPLGKITQGIASTLTGTANLGLLTEISKFPSSAMTLNATMPNMTGGFLANYKATKNAVLGTQNNLLSQYKQFKQAATAIQGNFLTAKKGLQFTFSGKNLKNLSKQAVGMIKAEANQAAKVAVTGIAMMGAAQIAQAIMAKPQTIAEVSILPTLGANQNTSTQFSLAKSFPSVMMA